MPVASLRYSTGVAGLDDLLGGGLLPGSLTVVVGASGIGKTQLGLQFAHAAIEPEGRRGILFDMTARIDSQSHAAYAERMFGWRLQVADAGRSPIPAEIFDAGQLPADYLHVFDLGGRRVTRGDLSHDAWHAWQADLAARLQGSIAFCYANFIRGARRMVIDGVEPADRPSDSIQFELFEYVYHQIIHKDSEWVARDLLRERYRAHAADAERAAYDHRQIACLLLYTCHETMLDALVERPLTDGDVLATANTLIYMGRVREGNRFSRALCVAKHRGSACREEITRFEIDDHGLRMV